MADPENKFYYQNLVLHFFSLHTEIPQRFCSRSFYFIQDTRSSSYYATTRLPFQTNVLCFAYLVLFIYSLKALYKALT